MEQSNSLWDTLSNLGQTGAGIIGALRPAPQTTVVQAPAPVVQGGGMSWQVMAGIGAAVVGLILLLVFMRRGK
jgi:hypothetical protein